MALSKEQLVRLLYEKDKQKPGVGPATPSAMHPMQPAHTPMNSMSQSIPGMHPLASGSAPAMQHNAFSTQPVVNRPPGVAPAMASFPRIQNSLKPRQSKKPML